MSDDERELCGKETSKGTPCQNYADTCPWDHDGGNDTGRETLFSEKTRQAIYQAAREGKTEEGCARAGGISDKTRKRWLKEGEADLDDGNDTQKAQFCRDYWQARAKGESKYVVDASPEFMLSSSFGYTKKQELEHSGEIDGFNFVIDARDDS